MLGLGIQELVIILVIVIVLFGARRIPEIMRGLGQGVHGFKKGLRGDDEEAGEETDGNSKGSPSS
ncbi:MAG: twin-arginine translocase TatA/TatE family subunit [Acidobacteria bacterium]|nr:twin-arginine translocase TatA/TatE family subunit [Acidobacteriota bacterium]NIM63578.1 twin-arginine translocase TatA/TatE family subunit [Acidobacteriota bacterium]NIO58440.1 twin-arginine translocase TatA/TatE family subunit [Acidobacteriota bacterium]NIQ29495.1 twin-arginine translocase TatA/TatE family subunit [Acidobacteriota bacterium]NIQ84172.1 twin-arginine translocase TatA/TatE family subunit [Acidobacteriota bacterium]